MKPCGFWEILPFVVVHRAVDNLWTLAPTPVVGFVDAPDMSMTFGRHCSRRQHETLGGSGARVKQPEGCRSPAHPL